MSRSVTTRAEPSSFVAIRTKECARFRGRVSTDLDPSGDSTALDGAFGKVIVSGA